MLMKRTKRFCVLTSSIIAVVANNISAQYSPTWVVKRAESTRRRTRIASARRAICTSWVSGFTTSMPAGRAPCTGNFSSTSQAITHPMQPATTAERKRTASAARRSTLRSSTSTSNPASATTISGAVKRRSSA